MNSERNQNKVLFSYEELQPQIITLYENYNYLNLSIEQFESLCLDIVLEIYEQNNNISQKQCIEILQTSLDKHVKNKLSNSKKTNQILTEFINKKLIIHDKWEKNIEELRKLNSFLIKYEIEENPELYYELLNNSTIYIMVENIVQTKLESINKIGFDVIDSNHNIQLLLEMYCETNQINYKSNYSEIFTDEYDTNMEVKSIDGLGLYLSQIAKPLLTKEEEQRLFILKEQGDSFAREKLIEHNLQLVVHVAKAYTGKGLDILDLIQEGNLGLVNAIEHFDYRKGYKLSTYATWWIKQSVQRGIMNTVRPIRIPVHMCEKLSKYGIAKSKLEKLLLREPTRDEICAEMKISKHQLIELEKATQNIVSINTLVGNEGDSDTELGDLIASDDDTIEEQYINSSRLEELLHILDRINLTEREKQVIKLRYGLYDGKIKTLEEVGKEFNITRERVRQIEAKAIRKIRYSPHITKLAALIDINVDTNVYINRHHSKRKTSEEQQKVKKLTIN